MDNDTSQLSEREKEVTGLLLQGKSNKQIAQALGISASTVEYHLGNIYKKLQISSRTEAVLRLGESIGGNKVAESGESIVEMNGETTDNGGKSISTQRFPMNKMFYLIGGGLLAAVLVVIIILVNVSKQNADIVPTVQVTSVIVPTVQATSTNALTNTPLPMATTAPTGTPTPISTFDNEDIDDMSNPALDLVDIRITVKNDLMDAIFYLKGVPPEFPFDREDGVCINCREYGWYIYVDTDNNRKTGASSGYLAGSDYCLEAFHVKSSDTPKTLPIEQGVQVAVAKLSGDKEQKISDGTIEVDTKGNTIRFSGRIPGITNVSQFYYQVVDGYSGSDTSSQLFDRLIIEK